MLPRAELDNKHKQMRALFVIELRAIIADPDLFGTPEYDAMGRELDDMLNTCAECCDQCAAIFCPYNEPLHGHHDGCPCCATEPEIEDQAERRAARVKRWETLLRINMAGVL